MSEKAKATSDPMPHLGRGNLSRRFWTEPEEPHIFHARKPVEQVRAEIVDAAVAINKVEIAKTALAAAEAKRGRGRPKTAKAWDGICSKTEWYRRQKAAPK